MTEKSPAQEIDDIIKMHPDWQGELLTRLRALIKQADPDLVESMKWKKPSKPEGVPVWEHDGILCIGETLKTAVRLTFPKGAKLNDQNKLFNRRLDSNSVRAVDFAESDKLDEDALKKLIHEAVALNLS